jgi:AcrR family transcriptional regulator
MPRVRANDYDAKKSKILDAAATLFADQGYAGSRMEEIATACGVSKSMLYHYFSKKEDVLFEILQEHVSDLVDAMRQYLVQNGLNDKLGFFRGFVEVYLQPSRNSRARHVVALHDMRYLTDEQKKEQIKLERELLGLVESMLESLKPGSPRDHYRVSAFLLFGMLNWVELWYRRSGRMSPSEFYEKVATLFLTGFLEESTSQALTKGLSSFAGEPVLVPLKRQLRRKRQPSATR